SAADRSYAPPVTGRRWCRRAWNTTGMVELNPFAHEFHEDPYPTYRWLRDNDPCHLNEDLGFWALTRYADVLDASRDWETFSSSDGPMIEKIDKGSLDA